MSNIWQICVCQMSNIWRRWWCHECQDFERQHSQRRGSCRWPLIEFLTWFLGNWFVNGFVSWQRRLSSNLKLQNEWGLDLVIFGFRCFIWFSFWKWGMVWTVWCTHKRQITQKFQELKTFLWQWESPEDLWYAPIKSTGLGLHFRKE